jgi:hypothetical protein
VRTWPHAEAVVVGHHGVPGLGSSDSSSSPSYLSVDQYAGPDGRRYQGKTVWSKSSPRPVRQALTVYVNPGSPGESYPVEKTSRAMLGCLFVVMAGSRAGSFFFLRVLVGS